MLPTELFLPLVHRGQNMRHFAYLLIVPFISASALYAAGQNNQQLSTSEKQQASKQGTQNPEAYELYLNGRSSWDKRTLSGLETAVSYFDQAVAKDPGYALAYEGLADTYAILPEYGGSPGEDIPKAKAAARKALELDATLGRPHAALAHTEFLHEWEFAGGEAEFKKAIELDPNDATAHQWYAESLFMLGNREQEALAEIKRAYQLDPQSLIIRRDFGADHTFIRQYDEAIAICKKLADESPSFYMAHYCLSDAYWRKRMYSQSIEEFKVASQLSGDRNDSELASAMDQGFRSGGWEGAYRKGIEVSLAQRKTGDSSAYTIATMYAELGEKDQAFQWLTTAFQERDQGLMGLKTDPSFDPIRSDPRFAELVRKVGLPQASKQGTQNPEAYALYLKGRSYSDKQTRADLEAAVSYFNQAITKDPGYALAYAGLTRAYAVLPDYGASASENIPKSKAAARKALELDPTLASVHISQGGTMMAHDWDFAGGEAEIRRGLELDPNDAHAHETYADNLGCLEGREQEALTEINRAHQLDPLSLSISVEIGVVYTDARRFDEAIGACRKVANENPTFAPAHVCLLYAYWGKRMYPQVIEEWKASGHLSGDREDSEIASSMEQGFRTAGWKGALTKGVETMKAQHKTGLWTAFNIATMYADMNDKEQAFQWLNTAYQDHEEGLMSLKTDFLLDPLRSDARFAELVRKVGLPQ